MCIICLMKNPFAHEGLSERDRVKERAKKLKVELDFLQQKLNALDSSDAEYAHFEELRKTLREEQYNIGQKL